MAVRLHLFGPPHADLDGVRLELSPHKPIYLLLHLACRREWVGREQLAGLFRPEAPDATARHTVRLLLSRARKLPWAQGLEAEAWRLRWRVDSDLHDFRAAVGRGDWAAATAVYAGPLLNGLPSLNLPAYDAWLDVEREHLHTAWRHAALRHSEVLAGEKAFAEAAALLRRLLHDDPLAEDVLQRYLRAAYLAGQRRDALAAYRSFAEALELELGLAPLETTRQLVDTVRASAPLAPVDTAPAKPSLPLSVQRPPRLVGRSAERAALARSAAAAVLVAGEPGVGKTRLLSEHHPQALRLACLEGVQHVPYFPVVQTVRELWPHLPGLGAYRRDLARLLPELGEPAPPGDPQTARARLLEALAAALETAQKALLFDDLQWADAGTLDVFALLAARRKVPLTGAYRSGEVTPRLDRTVAALRSSGWLEVVDVKPLARAEVQALLADLTGSEAGPPQFSGWLFDRSGGNPFFALETLKALFEAGRLRADEAGWHSDLDALTEAYAELTVPPLVLDVVRRRVRELSEAARRVLEAASVLRSDFTPQRLGPLTGLSEWALLDALAEAEVGGLVVGAAFQHDLLRQAVYSGLPAVRRRFLHGKVAAVLAADGAAEPLVVAEHWAEAGDLARAAALWFETASNRFDRQPGFVEEALTLYERVVALGTSTVYHDRAQAYLAGQYRSADRGDEARTLLQEVLQRSRDPLALAFALVQQAMFLYLDGDLTRAGEAAEAAAAYAEQTGERSLVRDALQARSFLAHMRGEYLTSLALVGPVVAEMRRAPPTFGFANWLSRLAADYCALGRFEEALACYTEQLAVARRLKLPSQQVMASSDIIATLYDLGRVEEGVALAEEALTLGHYESTYPLRYHLALAYFGQGRREDALEQAHFVAREASSVNLRAHAYALLAELHHPTELEQSRRALADGLALTADSDVSTAHAIIVVAALKFGSEAQLELVKPRLETLSADALPAYLQADFRAALALGRHLD